MRTSKVAYLSGSIAVCMTMLPEITDNGICAMFICGALLFGAGFICSAIERLIPSD